jgi:hypothetical protein
VAPGGEGHFTVLQVKSRLGEFVEVADVVVMEMGDDQVGDGPGIDADGGQALGWAAEPCAAPFFRHLGSEPHVDDEGAGARHRGPDEIIDGLGLVGVGGIDEIQFLGAVVGGVLDREKFINV